MNFSYERYGITFRVARFFNSNTTCLIFVFDLKFASNKSAEFESSSESE